MVDGKVMIEFFQVGKTLFLMVGWILSKPLWDPICDTKCMFIIQNRITVYFG